MAVSEWVEFSVNGSLLLIDGISLLNGAPTHDSHYTALCFCNNANLTAGSRGEMLEIPSTRNRIHMTIYSRFFLERSFFDKTCTCIWRRKLHNVTFAVTNSTIQKKQRHINKIILNANATL